MTQQRPITPPPELATKWVAEIYGDPVIPLHPITLALVERAAQWGADQELEACCALLDDLGGNGEMIRRYRRPKPPSLKEQALAILEDVAVYELHGGATTDNRLFAEDMSTIRRALEQLPDNE